MPERDPRSDPKPGDVMSIPGETRHVSAVYPRFGTGEILVRFAAAEENARLRAQVAILANALDEKLSDFTRDLETQEMTLRVDRETYQRWLKFIPDGAVAEAERHAKLRAAVEPLLPFAADLAASIRKDEHVVQWGGGPATKLTVGMLRALLAAAEPEVQP